MKLTNKLTLGLVFLLVIIVSFGILSMYYIQRLSNDANKILKNNQETLLYCSNMLNALEDMPVSSTALTEFENNLAKQEQNVTEPGEGDATNSVRAHFEALKKNITDSAQYAAIRK